MSENVKRVDPGLELVWIVADNVRAVAGRRNMSQVDVARALGVSTATVSMKWRGERPWSLQDMGRLASILRVGLPVLVARPEGFEPPTFWSGVASVIPITNRRRVVS